MRHFTATIILQILVILALVVFIYYTRQNVLGTVIVNPISKDTIQNNNESILQYYYEPKPNSVDKVNEWGPYNGIYTINSDALNERRDYDITKNNSVYRIVTLGDSYTYGLYVDTEDNWTEQLEDMLNSDQCKTYRSFEVINLGVHGYDLEYAVERYKLRGQKYNPDLILWLIKNDDLEQVNEVMFRKIQENKEISPGYESWNTAFNQTVGELGLDMIIEHQLQILKQFFEGYTGRVGFITFPQYNRFSLESIEETVPEGHAVDYIEVRDIYKYKELFYENDLHPTARGHKAIAQDIYGYILDNKVIPCN